MATLENLLSVYRAILLSEYLWTHNPARLDSYIQTARNAAYGESNGFKANGFCLFKAWKACGLPLPVTLEKLKGLDK